MAQHAVATPHFLSADAGREVLAAGGNAIDAAVAAVAAQGVVAPETCGLGGDLFALVHLPGWSRPRALNASGRSGSGADAQALRQAGHEEVPRDHPATVTVPGCVDGLQALASGLGVMPLADSLAPAIGLAEEGFTVSAEQARAFDLMSSVYRDNKAVADFYPDGRPLRQGDHVTRPALAATLRQIAEQGRDSFYRGTPGEDIVAAVGGLITPEDLDQDHAQWVEPIGVEAFGLTGWTVPPNSLGYLGPATLAVLEMLEPPTDDGDPVFWHLLVEAYRSLAWESHDVVADPDHVPIPPDRLMARERLERAAEAIDRERSGVWPAAIGSPSGTAYLCTTDSAGAAVSVIQSNYRGTGSPFGAARSGFLLQDRGGGFTLTPGHPNELRPGKRPLHTLAPTLWTRGERPAMVLGSRGGPVQPQLVAQVGARILLAGRSLEQAQEAPRWTAAQVGPGSASRLAVEPNFPSGVLADLMRRGHAVEEVGELQRGWGPVSVIEIDGDRRRAAPDPRVDTTAALVFDA